MALTVGSVPGSRGVPRNVQELVKSATNYDFDARVPLKYWLNTAGNMIKQVRRQRLSRISLIIIVGASVHA